MNNPTTRRTVLIAIGQAAIGAGISHALPGATEAQVQLPPGVYLPSRDHLSHALMSSERYHPVPAGCPTDYLRPRARPYVPLFFRSPEFEVIWRIVELMLGEPEGSGDTESCKQVVEWIDLRLASASAVREAVRRLNPLYRTLADAYFGPDRTKQTETADPETLCSHGLLWLADAAASEGVHGFLALPRDRQSSIVLSISDTRPDAKTDNAGTRFFAWLKPEVIRGFYTSKAGLRELDYKGNSFYARSPGCDRPV